MRCSIVVAALALVGGMAFPLQGQQTSDVDELRRQAEELNKKIKEIEEQAAQAPAPRGVTNIGASANEGRTGPLMVVRMYDLSDLFSVAPMYPAWLGGDLNDARSYPFGFFNYPGNSGGPGGGPGMGGSMGGGMGGGGMGGGGGGGGGFFNYPPEGAGQPLRQMGGESDLPKSISDARTGIADLITAIESTISTGKWSARGGDMTIKQLGLGLLISADAGTHKQIETLMALFRKRWGTLRTVSLRAHWVWLDDEQLQQLVGSNEQEQQADVKDRLAYGLVEDDAWQALQAELAEFPETAPGNYRAAVTCYNGQTVHAVCDGQSFAVSAVEPVAESTDGEVIKSVAYRATTRVIHEGAALQVTPVCNTSGKFVVLDIQSRVCRVKPQAPAAKESTDDQVRPQIGGGLDSQPRPAELIASLDRPEVQTQRLSTTLRVPVDRTMLVGGMTFSTRPKPGEPSLYLFVRLSVQELRDDIEPDELQVPNTAAADAPPPVDNEDEGKASTPK